MRNLPLMLVDPKTLHAKDQRRTIQLITMILFGTLVTYKGANQIKNHVLLLVRED